MKRKAKNFQVYTIGTVGTVVLSRDPELVNITIACLHE
jgi:hypothetical protein